MINQGRTHARVSQSHLQQQLQPCNHTLRTRRPHRTLDKSTTTRVEPANPPRASFPCPAALTNTDLESNTGCH